MGGVLDVAWAPGDETRGTPAIRTPGYGNLVRKSWFGRIRFSDNRYRLIGGSGVRTTQPRGALEPVERSRLWVHERGDRAAIRRSETGGEGRIPCPPVKPGSALVLRRGSCGRGRRRCAAAGMPHGRVAGVRVPSGGRRRENRRERWKRNLPAGFGSKKAWKNRCFRSPSRSMRPRENGSDWSR